MTRPGPIEFEVHIIGVDPDKCEACGQCVFICPTGVWEMKDGVASPVKPESCLGCMGCVGVCPGSAITITEI